MRVETRKGEQRNAIEQLAQVGKKADAPRRVAHHVGAFEAVVAAVRPGTRDRGVYAVWQGKIDAGGFSREQRHHCGYAVGIGFPPGRTVGNTVTDVVPEILTPASDGITIR